MITNSFEDSIQFHLVKTSSRPSKEGAFTYHAVTGHDTIDMMALAKANDRTLTDYIGHENPVTALWIAEGVIRAMAMGVMKDGRSRRLGDLLLVRGDVKGRFDRIDAAFDPKVHTFEISVQTLQGLKELGREEPPVNAVKRPEGRIDHVTSPGCDYGQLYVGREIQIYGHDLKLLKGDTVALSWMDKATWEKKTWTVRYGDPDSPGRFLENSDTLLRLAWFGPTHESRVYHHAAKLMVNLCNRAHANPTVRGSSSEIQLQGLVYA